MALSLTELTAHHPDVSASPAVAAGSPARVLVVLDDDPTGTQSIADLPVLNDWSVESLTWALREGAPAIYVMTNSRSLDPADAEQRNREVARAAFAAAEAVGVEVAFVSRSDSTLRGHFPLEPETLAAEVLAHEGRPIDGIVIVPAFPSAGRITVDGVHYAGNPTDGYTPAGETEFARDATFGYASSHLADWVAEKTQGRVAASEVIALGLTELRTDHDAVVAALRSASGARPIITDIVTEDDLARLALALHAAEAAGSRFLYRVGPPFVRAMIGQAVREPLTRDDLDRLFPERATAATAGGLVVVGSHVSMTTQQLNALRERRTPTEFEIDVTQVLGDDRDAHLTEVVDAAVAGLATGNVVVRTSRTLVKTADAAESLAIARAVSAAVVEVVQRVLAAARPRFVVAKGGITSSDVAAHGLQIGRAYARGAMLPGIISLWEPMDGPAVGVPYIVFPGNVGGPQALADVVDSLSA